MMNKTEKQIINYN